MALRISGVPDVCGAFFGRVMSENLGAGIGYSFVASRSRLSQQGFELGEDLLDGIEVGRVFGQEDEARADLPDRPPHGLPFMRAEVIEDHDVARLEGGEQGTARRRRGSVRR